MNIIPSATFNIKMEEHLNNISWTIKELWEEKAFSDIELVCKNGRTKAHKFMLAACSPFFQSLLKRNKDTDILLKGVRIQDLNSILMFIYKGEVVVAKDDLQPFLEVASDLDIKGLAKWDEVGPWNDDSEPKMDHGNIEKDLKAGAKGYAENIITVNDESVEEENISSSENEDIDDGGNDERMQAPELNSSLRRSSGDEGNMWECVLCGKKKKNKAHMKRHIEAHNVDGKNHSCQMCNNKFKTKNSLNVHMSRYHQLNVQQ